jgi:hypothetical protein
MPTNGTDSLLGSITLYCLTNTSPKGTEEAKQRKNQPFSTVYRKHHYHLYLPTFKNNNFIFYYYY